jgi:UDP-2,3-diacylglucosamine hydrolase
MADATIQVPKAQPDPVALFVSDVHLRQSLPRTTEAFLSFLKGRGSQTEALYLLGDLFEYWAGDDDLADPYNARIAQEIKALSSAGVKVGWIGGNRDFLVGRNFAQACGINLLPDPHLITIGGRRIVILHGDEQCTDDTDYMVFRRQVRTAAWQERFLAMPLTQRKAIIDEMRTNSRAAQREKAYEIMDVNPEAVAAVFKSTDASVMIHGHTHRPAMHNLTVDGKQVKRYVLPDWDCEAPPLRGGWLEMYADGTIRRFRYDGSEL